MTPTKGGGGKHRTCVYIPHASTNCCLFRQYVANKLIRTTSVGRARVNYSWLLTMEDERRRERGEARSQMVTNGVLIMPGCFLLFSPSWYCFLFTIFPLSFSLCTHCVCVVNNSNDESSHTHTHTHSVVERKAKKSYLKFCHKTFPGFSLSLLLLFFSLIILFSPRSALICLLCWSLLPTQFLCGILFSSLFLFRQREKEKRGRGKQGPSPLLLFKVYHTRPHPACSNTG